MSAADRDDRAASHDARRVADRAARSGKVPARCDRGRVARTGIGRRLLDEGRAALRRELGPPDRVALPGEDLDRRARRPSPGADQASRPGSRVNAPSAGRVVEHRRAEVRAGPVAASTAYRLSGPASRAAARESTRRSRVPSASQRTCQRVDVVGEDLHVAAPSRRPRAEHQPALVREPGQRRRPPARRCRPTTRAATPSGRERSGSQASRPGSPRPLAGRRVDPDGPSAASSTTRLDEQVAAVPAREHGPMVVGDGAGDGVVGPFHT